MSTLTKYIASKTVQPAVKKYLAKTRIYQYRNISLLIPPGVFHPGLFFSTKILLNYILQLDLNEKQVLELGAGSGLISFAAAQKNAIVTATDINDLVIEYIKINSQKNNIPLNVFQSDLFENIPQKLFDVIAINPPFYKKNSQTKSDYAWYCGENGEYFYKLFDQLKNFVHSATSVLMVLSEDCDITMIRNIARKNVFSLKLVQTKKNLLERNFVFSIEETKLDFSRYNLVDNVYVNAEAAINKEFEEKYIELRIRENRVYTNREVKHLPSIQDTHPHYKEWILRTKSASKLFEYLQQKKQSLKILEVGCGNCWLSNFLSRSANNYVVGLDVNFTELKQAAQVFKKDNLFFVHDVLSEKFLANFNFDIVVFAASAQYFPSITGTINMILPLLNQNGEVHIIDTNFYKSGDSQAAQKRTKEYYSKLGFPEFAERYYNHSLNELGNFKIDKLYNPLAFKNIFSKQKNPFPWFRIKN